MIQLRVFLSVILLVSVGMFATIGCHGGTGSGPNQQSMENAKKRVAPLSAAQAVTLCPQPAGHAPKAPQPGTGHHTVTLTWNASAPSPNPESNAVGYCLYRGKEKKEAKRGKNGGKQIPTFGELGQINSVPIAGTGCVDDLVEDGATYDYVVKAVNAKGIPSGPSNYASAMIPVGKRSNPLPLRQFPSCRGASDTK